MELGGLVDGTRRFGPRVKRRFGFAHRVPEAVKESMSKSLERAKVMNKRFTLLALGLLLTALSGCASVYTNIERTGPEHLSGHPDQARLLQGVRRPLHLPRRDRDEDDLPTRRRALSAPSASYISLLTGSRRLARSRGFGLDGLRALGLTGARGMVIAKTSPLEEPKWRPRRSSSKLGCNARVGGSRYRPSSSGR